MPELVTKTTQADHLKWQAHHKAAWRKRFPNAKPIEDDPPDWIDLTPPPDARPPKDVTAALESAASHTACRPGAIAVFNPEDRSLTICPVRCKTWTCPTCGPVLARLWAKRIADAKPQRMITLTCDHGHFPRPDLAYDAMKAALTQLVRLIRKVIGPIQYAAVWEVHQDGYPHLHLAHKGTFIPQKWLSKAWDNLGIGPIVDIRKVTTGKAAAVYMAKYMTKTVQAGKTGLGLTRVIQASSHYFERTLFKQTSLVPPGGVTVRCRKSPYDAIRHLIAECRYTIDISNPGPPWRMVPTADAAHSPSPDAVLGSLTIL